MAQNRGKREASDLYTGWSVGGHGAKKRPSSGSEFGSAENKRKTRRHISCLNLSHTSPFPPFFPHPKLIRRAVPHHGRRSVSRTSRPPHRKSYEGSSPPTLRLSLADQTIRRGSRNQPIRKRDGGCGCVHPISWIDEIGTCHTRDGSDCPYGSELGKCSKKVLEVGIEGSSTESVSRSQNLMTSVLPLLDTPVVE